MSKSSQSNSMLFHTGSLEDSDAGRFQLWTSRVSHSRRLWIAHASRTVLTIDLDTGQISIKLTLGTVNTSIALPSIDGMGSPSMYSSVGAISAISASTT